MFKEAVIILLTAVLLTACGTAVSKQVENDQGAVEGTYDLRYEYGAVDSYSAIQTALAAEASALCPEGWTKTKEALEDQGAGLAPVYVWQVRCAADS